MSAYSTLYITRTKALQMYLQHFNTITNSELEKFMDNLLERRLYNVRIVEDCEDNDDKEI